LTRGLETGHYRNPELRTLGVAYGQCLAGGTRRIRPLADALRLLATLAGVGLLVSFVMLSYGLDLNPGFF
jgi:hypothetical protein